MGLVASPQSDELRKEALVKPQTVLHGLAGNGPEAVRSKAAIAAAVRKRQERPQRGSKKERALLAPSKARDRLGSVTATEKDTVEKEG